MGVGEQPVNSPFLTNANKMQSIFSPAARRDTLRVRANVDRRDGELKMDWTEPLHEAGPMGIDWLGEPVTKREKRAAGDDGAALRGIRDDSGGSKAWSAGISTRHSGIRHGGRQSFAAGPNS
jgi:hypothetical protein